MLTRADLANLRPSTVLDAPGPVVAVGKVREELYQRLSQLPVGKPLPAEVLALFDDGTQLVKIADANARMVLPMGTKVGDTFSMALVAKEPRPTFLLVPPEESAPANLSTTARLVDHLLQSAPQEKPLPVRPANPVLPAPELARAPQPEALATALRDSVESSGIFYESHLREWTEGGRSLEDVKQEPQARLPGFNAPASEQQRSEPPTASQLTRLAARLGDANAMAGTLDRVIEQTHAAQAQSSLHQAADVTVIMAATPSLPEIAPEAANMIQQQLAILEHQRIEWRGELVPGQPMEWEISREEPRKNAPSEAEGSWSSRLRLTLPALGEISATIRLTGDRVQVQLDAASDESSQALQEHGAALADALAAAGSPLEFFSVKRHGAS
ncbi:flagellar hook-length control protein FliK [Noviherbaspirillum galbum]|uniref:Flagellar hook-length control protein FliK n=1 Tax=Noviherbaspirillum galbum TaxID=2709383 RepID=A0A6B3SWE1_9BURK|nr:flagellar hook-length control protein FliK [Noviherbaspirillum galbum]NEX62702.1 flagellar hook-length control protein FliK [Noviherbaspirillum galbum]